MECSNQLENRMINMMIKIAIFDFFTQVPGQTTILAGFTAFFYADSCRRYVRSSFLISSLQRHPNLNAGPKSKKKRIGKMLI